MRIAIVADKKAGHLSQCLGLRGILQSQSHEKDVFYLNQNLISLPGFIERALLLLGEKLLFFHFKTSKSLVW